MSAKQTDKVPSKPSKLSNTLRYSFRLSGRSTSITLRRNIVSLYLLFSEADADLDNVVFKFIDSCIDKWKGETAKGLSDFITARMIRNILTRDDFKQYKHLFSRLQRDDDDS